MFIRLRYLFLWEDFYFSAMLFASVKCVIFDPFAGTL